MDYLPASCASDRRYLPCPTLHPSKVASPSAPRVQKMQDASADNTAGLEPADRAATMAALVITSTSRLTRSPTARLGSTMQRCVWGTSMIAKMPVVGSASVMVKLVP